VSDNRQIVLKVRLREVAGNMTNPELEEKLREAACFGDIEGVKVSPTVADPGSGAFLTSGPGPRSGIGFFRIRDSKPIFLRGYR
jgi:hypothetical protein